MINFIKRKYKWYKARKQIIEKYNDAQCSLNFTEFKSKVKEYNRCFFIQHHNVENLLTAYDKNDYDEISISKWLDALSNNTTLLKQEYENLLKFNAHKVRMAHWMYVHHKSKIMVGETFKEYYELMKDKYEQEFKHFDVSFEYKKYKIKKRKEELEDDFKLPETEVIEILKNIIDTLDNM